MQTEWGGVTIDAHTGQNVTADGGDKYALTVRPPGVYSVSVPIGADKATFDAAMVEARSRFSEVLRNQGYHLGVFRDDAIDQIDIDPVLVTTSHDDVEAIGAYTQAVGGAYNFADGNGYWPPYVDEGEASARAAAVSGPRRVVFKGQEPRGPPTQAGRSASTGTGRVWRPYRSEAARELTAGGPGSGRYPKGSGRKNAPKAPAAAATQGLQFNADVPKNVQSSVEKAYAQIKAAGVDPGDMQVVVASDSEDALATAARDKFYVTPKLADDAFMTNYAQEWDGIGIAGGGNMERARQAVAIHEMGHVLDRRVRERGMGSEAGMGYNPLAAIADESVPARSLGYTVGDVDKPVLRWQLDALRTADGSPQSVYANQRQGEWIAEAFADGVVNGDQASESGKRVLEVMRNELPAKA